METKKHVVVHTSFNKNKTGNVLRFVQVRSEWASEEEFMSCTCGKIGKQLKLLF